MAFYALSLVAVETAPRITDREIIESLAELKAGQKALEQKMDQRFEAVEQRFEERFEAMERRFDLLKSPVGADCRCFRADRFRSVGPKDGNEAS